MDNIPSVENLNLPQQRDLLDENKELKNTIVLLQSCLKISGCLDPAMVHHLLIDAVAREIGVRRAIGLFLLNGKLELKEVLGIPDDLGKSLSNEIISGQPGEVPEPNLIEKIHLSPAVSADGISDAYLVHIRIRSVYYGLIAFFNDSAEELPDISKRQKNILFLIEQSVQALENVRTFSQAQDMLFIDDVSGLFNYRYLEVALERELKRVERYSSHLAVLFIDVDAFKMVNDRHGHLVGSQVLARFGAFLKELVRDVDIVIRYGGDEYTIILVETPCQIAEIVAERIRRQVEAHLFMEAEGYNITLTCSIGYSCCPDDAVTTAQLLEIADKAMYEGKAAGRNCVKRIVKK